LPEKPRNAWHGAVDKCFASTTKEFAMLNKFCPGSMSLKQPTPEDIECSGCGRTIEIWSDETKVRCRYCGTMNFKDVAPSCVEWCPAAVECVGPEIYQRVTGKVPSLKKH
jgi:LSD1 subclass zinc finger protein